MQGAKRGILTVVVTVFLGMMGAAPVGADPPGSQVVVGQDTPAADVAAVQAAVSAGGRVVLVGTFDFGPAGSVIIGKDVRISGRDGATIKGGATSFLSPLPAPVGQPPAQPGPAITIENLIFDGATFAPVLIAYARSVDIHHNTIRNVVPRFNPAIHFALQMGILVTTQPQTGSAVVPGAITGRVRIHHNHLDMTSPDPASTVGAGIRLVLAWGVDGEISHNTVSNFVGSGVEATDNARDNAGAGRIRVSHNHLRGSSAGAPYPVPYRPTGIVAGWFLLPAGAINPVRNPVYEISENDVAVAGRAPVAIFANANGVVLKENRVAVSTTGARGIVLASANGLAEENEVTGQGQFAIQVAPFFPALPAVVADGNTLLCNDLAGFHADVADLGLGGNNNTVIGTWASVLDTGTGNQLVPSAGCEYEEH